MLIKISMFLKKHCGLWEECLTTDMNGDGLNLGCAEVGLDEFNTSYNGQEFWLNKQEAIDEIN